MQKRVSRLSWKNANRFGETDKCSGWKRALEKEDAVTQRLQDALLPLAHRGRRWQWRRLFAAVSILVLLSGGSSVGFGQRTQSDKTGSHSSRGVRPGLTP